MRFRKLRITWSIVCALACVLLSMLWARSYWWNDQYFCQFSAKFLVIESYEGELTLGFTAPTKSWQMPQDLDLEWWGGQSILMMEHHVYYTSHTSYDDNASLFTKLIRPFRRELPIGIVVPTWFVVGLLAMLAIAPWIRHLSWRFSLRTLLIIMALVALVMGLIFYAGRDPWFDIVQPE